MVDGWVLGTCGGHPKEKAELLFWVSHIILKQFKFVQDILLSTFSFMFCFSFSPISMIGDIISYKKCGNQGNQGSKILSSLFDTTQLVND